MHLIERVRRNDRGQVTHVEWFKLTPAGQSISMEARVIEAVDALHNGEDVRIFVRGQRGARVRPVPGGGGWETIGDILGAPLDQSKLTDVPEF